jgi:RND family efflux transporter MFP subunit
MNKRTLVRAGTALAAVALVIIITQLVKKSGGKDVMEPPIRPVKTMLIQDTPSQFRRVFSGQMQASQTANLSFLTGGDLVEFPVKEGDFLKKDELIARLDATEAQNAFEAARADLTLAKAELERNQTLYDEELISAAEFDVKRRAFDVSLAAYNTAAKAVQDREIRAPFDGVIAKRFVDNHEKVQAGQTIVTFFNPTSIDIIIDVPETIVNQIPYHTAEMTAVFEQNPNVSYPLTVKEFSTVADKYTKTYALTLTMEKPEGVLVLPDMTVTVNIDFKRKAVVTDESFLVPSTAIVFDVETDDSVIWVLDKETMTVNPKSVEADRTQGGEVVISGGLEVGDTIVTAGGGFLSPGQKVRIYEQ